VREAVRMHLRLDLAVAALEALRVEREGRLQAEELEVVLQTARR
jgi:hypothetical protein